MLIEVSEKEKELLELCREIEWGKFEVIVKNKQPVMTKQGVKDRQLGGTFTKE